MSILNKQKKIELELDGDNLGRKFKISSNPDRHGEASCYPCRDCTNAIFYIDHYCCRLLAHNWDELGEFSGEDVFPKTGLKKTSDHQPPSRLNRPFEYIDFYECSSRK